MNRYLYINPDDKTVGSIINEEDPVFPGIPIADRYSPDFLKECIVKPEEDVTEVQTGMVYDSETDTFSWPPVPEPEPEPEPEEPGYTVTQEEIDAAYKEGVNDVE